MSMVKRWTDRKTIIGLAGSSIMMGHIWWIIGVVFVVLGVIADAINAPNGLEPLSWFLLAIVAFLAGMSYFIYWAVAMYLDTVEAKTKKEE